MNTMKAFLFLLLIPFSSLGQKFYIGEKITITKNEFHSLGASSTTNVFTYKYIGRVTDKYFYGRIVDDIIIGIKEGFIVTTIYELIPESNDIGVPNSIVNLISGALPYPLEKRGGIYGVNIDNISLSLSRSNNTLTFNKDRIMFLSTIKNSLLTGDISSIFPTENRFKAKQIPDLISWDKNSLQKQLKLITDYVVGNPEKNTTYVKFLKSMMPNKVENLEKFWEEYESEFKNDGNYPESIYKVIRNDVGNVIAIFDIPVRDGDSEISFAHYFDENGKTFAFRIEADTYTGDDHLIETVSEYYNKEFKRVAKEHKLANESGQLIDRSKYASIIEFINIPYKPEGNLQLLKKRLRLSSF